MIKHVKECDCYECSGDPYIKSLHEKFNKSDRMLSTGRTDNFDVAPFVGKFVRSNSPINVYKGPGEKVWRTAKPQSYIGAVESFNTKQNWIKLTNGDWIYYEPTKLQFNAPDNSAPHEFTTWEKMQLALASQPATSPASGIGQAVAIGATGAAESVVDFLPDWSTLKWILIGVVVVILIAVVYKITK